MIKKALLLLLCVLLTGPAAMACPGSANANEPACTCPSGGDCSCKDKCSCTGEKVESCTGSAEACQVR